MALQGYKLSKLNNAIHDDGEPKAKRFKSTNGNNVILSTFGQMGCNLKMGECKLSDENRHSLQDSNYRICSPQNKDFHYNLHIM